jgi:hypothetical protein
MKIGARERCICCNEDAPSFGRRTRPGSFSVATQAVRLGPLPRLKIVDTSAASIVLTVP